LLDPGEINDLADTEAEKLRELVEFWHQYEAETGTVLKGAGDGPGREKFFGVKWDDWDGPKSVENIGYGPR
jgi:arylsulfatase